MNEYPKYEQVMKKGFTGRRSLEAAILLMVFMPICLYLYAWYFTPTSSVARFSYCVRDIFSNGSHGLDASDGKISGFFAEQPKREHHFGMIYTALLFSEDGNVSVYQVAGSSRTVEVHKILFWRELYKYPFLSPADTPPNYGTYAPMRGVSFWILHPITVSYSMSGNQINVKIDQQENWNGTLSDDTLIFKVSIGDFEREDRYFYYSYDTCPFK